MTRLWAFFSLSVAIYGFGGYLVTTAHNVQEAALYWQIAYIGIILIPFFFVFFIFEFLNIRHPLFFKITAFLTTVFLFANFFSRKLFINDCTLYFENIKWVTPIYFVFPPGFLLYFFILYSFFGSLIYAHFEILTNYKKASVAKRNQIKYFVFATVIGFAGGGASFLPCFGISVYPIFNFTVFLYPLIMTYAILRYRLMDINVAVTRTGTFIAVYTLVLGLPFALAIWAKGWLIEIFGAVWWTLPLGLMAALATVGPFIYIYVESKAEGRLLKEQKRYQDTLKQASVGMTRIRNLRRLLSLITHIVTKTVRISYAAIYLYNKETDEFILQASRDHKREPLTKFNAKNTLISRLSVKREPLIYEEVKRQFEDAEDAVYKELESDMRSLGASVVIPSFLEDKFMGFIVLGDKLSGQIYTVDDLNVFRVLASQAALAIENAQFYEETKEMQQQVAQAEKMATVGTMADGLSHQINNRFYALALIAGDTIDTIKTTDTSKCDPAMKEMIKQINYALERIQANVMQGGEVVKGILKYTRKGEEKFEELPLDKIIDGTLEMVQYKVKLSEIDFVRDYPKTLPKIKGNMVQLQEVFFNLIDNAFDAAVERRDTLKEKDFRGKIIVSARPKDENNLEIIVQDNGIGVKGADNKKLFTPFFTTKTSSHKGTGLGLYVIQRIVADTHKGKIAFESQYKSGTRFIIELPMAK